MTNFRKEFERAKARAGLDFEWRDLRRTGARMMLVQGVDLATVSSFLGHATLAMTEAYVGAQAEHKRAAVEALAGLYRAPEPDPEPGASEVSDSAKNAGKVSDLVSVR
jgi:integrase